MPFWKRGEPKPKTYGFDRGDLGRNYSRWGRSIYVEVNGSGIVVSHGNPLRTNAPKDRIHFIGLPTVYGFEGRRDVTAKLEIPIDGANVAVIVKLTVRFTQESDGDIVFDPQDVYENITKQGYEDFDDMIKGNFLSKAEKSNAVKQAFINYKKHERPVQFVEELSTVLKTLNVNGRPLSNVVETRFRVELNTVSATLEGKYT